MTQVPGGEVLVYETPEGDVRVDVRLDHDTVWLTQRQMAELFDSSTDNIGLHLKNIFGDNELDEAVTTEDFSVVQSEGKRRVRRQVKHYNLDAIISVGYRVNSRRGVRFRQWATGTLREHLKDRADGLHAVILVAFTLGWLLRFVMWWLTALTQETAAASGCQTSHVE